MNKKSTKLVDIKDAGKARADREMKPILDALAINNAHGMSTVDLLKLVDETNAFIRVAMLDYYMSIYESSEPGVAAHNIKDLSGELIMLAQGAITVPAKAGDKFLPIHPEDIKTLAIVLQSHPELSALREVVQEIAAWIYRP